MIDKLAIYLGWTGIFITFLPLLISLRGGWRVVKMPYLIIWIYLIVVSILNAVTAYFYLYYPLGTASLTPYLSFCDVLGFMIFFIYLKDPFSKLYLLLMFIMIGVNIYRFYILKENSDFEELSTIISVIISFASSLALRGIFFNQKFNKILNSPSFYFIFGIFAIHFFSIAILPLGSFWRETFDAYPYLSLVLANINYILSIIIFTVGFWKIK